MMTLQRIHVISPAGEPSLASPDAAERLKGEGWIVVGDTPATEKTEAKTEPDTGDEPKLDYKAGLARLKELNPEFKGRPKKDELEKLLAEAEAAASEEPVDPVSQYEADLAKVSIEQAIELLDEREIEYSEDADVEQLGEILLDWAKAASEEDLAKLIDDLAGLLAEEAN